MMRFRVRAAKAEEGTRRKLRGWKADHRGEQRADRRDGRRRRVRTAKRWQRKEKRGGSRGSLERGAEMRAAERTRVISVGAGMRRAMRVGRASGRHAIAHHSSSGMRQHWSALSLAAVLLALARAAAEDASGCPRVKAIRNLDIAQLLGAWYVVQYYASSEEALSYRCMRAELSVRPDEPEVTMNFTYSFADDPMNEQLFGNITWRIPKAQEPAHWLHAELPYEGVYNTYVLDSDYESWALLMHCAEQASSPRYLSSLIMSRQPALQSNVVSYLREKLPRYGVDLEYMFSMQQTSCQTLDPLVAKPAAAAAGPAANRSQRRQHPLRRKNKKTLQHI